MKIPFVNFSLYKSILKNELLINQSDSQSSEKPEVAAYVKPIRTFSRSTTIVPYFIDKTISVHTGNGFIKVRINEDMVGLKLGCFALTKKLGKSIHNSEHNRKKIAKMRRKITQKKIRKNAPAKSKTKKVKKKK